MKNLFLLILSILSLGNANAQTKDEVLELAPLSHDFVKAVGGLVNITNV